MERYRAREYLYNFPTINLFIWLDGELSLKRGGATNPYEASVARSFCYETRDIPFRPLERFIGVFPKQQHVRRVLVCVPSLPRVGGPKRERCTRVCVWLSVFSFVPFHPPFRPAIAFVCLLRTALTTRNVRSFVYLSLMRSMWWSYETRFSFEATVQTFRRAFQSLALRLSWVKTENFFVPIFVSIGRKFEKLKINSLAVVPLLKVNFFREFRLVRFFDFDIEKQKCNSIIDFNELFKLFGKKLNEKEKHNSQKINSIQSKISRRFVLRKSSSEKKKQIAISCHFVIYEWQIWIFKIVKQKLAQQKKANKQPSDCV